MTDETGARTTQLEDQPTLVGADGLAESPVPGAESAADWAPVWSRALGVLEQTVTQQQERALVRLSRLDGVVGETALLSVPNHYAKDVIEARLRQVISAVLSEQVGHELRLAVVVDPSLDTETGGRGLALRGRAVDRGRPPSRRRRSTPAGRRPGHRPRAGSPRGASRPGSTRGTCSRRSSSARATGSPTPRRSRSPRRRPRRTTRCSSTATPGWARPTCCTRSGTTA